MNRYILEIIKKYDKFKKLKEKYDFCKSRT